MDQDTIITAFVAHLAGLGNPGLLVNKWPDKNNRSTPDIDAVAGNFAIEHTSTEVVGGMRKKNAWFMKAAGELESELNPSMRYRLRINIDYEAVDKGQKWNQVKTALRDWIVNEAPSLTEGFHTIQPIGVPFELRIQKATDEAPSLVFSRLYDPVNDTLETSIGPLIIRKAGKLVPYKQSGMTGILLIQSEDLALMNRGRLAQAIVRAFPDTLPEGVDQIWYADATIRPHIEFHNLTALGSQFKEE